MLTTDKKYRLAYLGCPTEWQAKPEDSSVAYMPVPRCETCSEWNVSQNYTYGGHKCKALSIVTDKDFGCTLWKAKS
jgi:hypothetical protein